MATSITVAVPPCLHYLACSPAHVHQTLWPQPRAGNHSWALQDLRSYDGLDELRYHIKVCTHVYKKIGSHMDNTHALNTIEAITAKIRSSRDKYRAARAALVSLSSCYDSTFRSTPYVIFSHAYLSGPRDTLRIQHG